MQAIAYVRVSTDRQVDVGASLETQSERVRAMAVVQCRVLTEVIVDAGESAKSLERPGLQRLLAMVEKGAVEMVIIAKLDRLTRSVADLAELLRRFERRGVALVSVADALDTGSAAGRLVLNIMVSVSQWEREAIGERTRDVLRHKRDAGQRVGTVPYGFRLAGDGRSLEQNPAEQAVVATMQCHKARGRTVRQIAEVLNSEGHRTRRGTPWRFQYVAVALARATTLAGSVPERAAARNRSSATTVANLDGALARPDDTRQSDVALFP